MGYARQSLVCLQDTPYYHVIARCVRRAWLWGFDEYAGRDYSHRKSWVLERLQRLTGVFAIDVCAYAVMSNHYHLVVHVAQRRSTAWSNDEVVERWSQVFGVPLIVHRWREGAADEVEAAAAVQLIESWRTRLTDVSWFMRCLNEHLARRANAEDDCTGRFWEGRFKSQALLDEAGLLTAMAYVDLNPVRAGVACTPEESCFTSIHARILALKGLSGSDGSDLPIPPVRLLAFCDHSHADASIPMALADYLQLVDWSGRILRRDNRGAIEEQAPPILNRLNINPVVWRDAMQISGYVFGRALGRLDLLRLHAHALRQAWIKGHVYARRLYRSD